MGTFRLCVFALATAILAAAPTAARAENCTLQQLASLDMLDGPDVVVPATINGSQVHMLVDTGGIASSIFSDTAAHLGLHATGQISRDEALVDVQGRKIDELVVVPEVGLGAMRGRNVTFLWWPRTQDPPQIDGILAPDLLRRYDVDIDFADRKVKLFAPEHCAGHVVYWASDYDSIPFSIDAGGQIEIPIILDGKEIRAIIDTGASVTALSKRHAMQLFDIDETSPGIEKIPGATTNSFIRYQYRFKQLSFGAIRVSNPVIAILPDAGERALHTEAFRWAGDPAFGPTIDVRPVLLGLNILRKLHLYIAYSEQTIYVTAAETAVPESPAPTAVAGPPSNKQ